MGGRQRMFKAPAFQLYAADFYMDTNGWTPEEIGIYFRLLMHEWVSGGLPNDPKRLASISQCSYKKFQFGWEIIQKKFIQNGNGLLINKRLEIARQEQEEYRESQIESGKRGAERRWKGRIKKDSKPNGDPIGDPIGDPNGEKMALQSSSSSSIKIKNKRYIHIPPSLEDVKNYCKEQNNTIDPEVWFDYYTANGFMVGKNKMKDWKATVRNWERKEQRQPQTNYTDDDKCGTCGRLIAKIDRRGSECVYCQKEKGKPHD